MTGLHFHSLIQLNHPQTHHHRHHRLRRHHRHYHRRPHQPHHHHHHHRWHRHRHWLCHRRHCHNLIIDKSIIIRNITSRTFTYSFDKETAHAQYSLQSDIQACADFN